MINLTNIWQNPKTEVYEKVKENLPKVIDEVLNEINLQNNNLSEKIIANNATIKSNEEKVETRRKDDQINKKKGVNITLAGTGIGLLSKKYKDNKESIKNFESFSENITSVNNELASHNLDMAKIYGSDFSFVNLFKKVLEKFGLLVVDEICETEASLFNSKVNESKAVTVLKTKVRDSFAYWFTTSVVENKVITTSNSKTFEYTAWKNSSKDTVGKSKEKVITAFHDEPTPFVHSTHQFLFRSNFLKDLKFETLVNTKNYFQFKNKKFSKKYQIGNFENPNAGRAAQLESLQKLVQFFSDTTQNLWESWDRPLTSEVPKIYKTSEGLLFTSMNLDDQSFNAFFQSEPYLNYLNNQGLVELDKLRSEIHKKLTDVVLEYFGYLMYPMMVTGIAREKYHPSGNYLISDEVSANTEAHVEHCETNFVQHINVVNNINMTFSTSQKPKKKPIITLDKFSNENGFYNYDFLYNSYWSEILEDLVTVKDTECGDCPVPVKYEKFHSFQEKKKLLFLPLKNDEKIEIVFSKNLKKQLFNKGFDAINPGPLNEMGAWISNKKAFEKKDNQVRVLGLLADLDTLNSQVNYSLSLTKNDKGLWCVLNSPQALQADQVAKLHEILRNLAEN